MGNASSALDCCSKQDGLSGAGLGIGRTDELSDLHRAARDNNVRQLELILSTPAQARAVILEVCHEWHRGETRTTRPGINVDATDQRGRTPLHWAAQHGCSNTLDLLLRSGANTHAKSLDGKTALTLAMENRHNDLVQKLLEKQTQQQHAGGGNTKSNGRVMLSAQQPLPHLAQSGKGKSAEALHAEAAAHYFAGDHNKAEKIYQQALQVNPRHLRTLCNYGALLQNARNEFDRAEELYQAALSVDPADAVTLYNYGLLLENARSDFKGAERMYQRALNSDPKHVDTLCNYGALLKTAYGEYETAKDMYEAALQVDAQHVDTLCNYALLCRDALHDKPKAAQLIKRALAIAPNDEWLQRHAKSFD